MNLRKKHRLVAVIICLPLLIIAVTGMLLLFRNQFDWIQPASVKNELKQERPLLTIEEIQNKFGNGVEQIIYRPTNGNLTVRMHDGGEIQLHPQTGEVQKVAKRRTGILIELHQGSWLGSLGQYFVHFITGIGLIFLVFSGLLIWPLRKG